MKFKGYFIRTNFSLGCIISDATNTNEAIKRTVFDAIYQSPWTEADITVLRVHELETDSVLYVCDHETLSVDFKALLGS